MKYIMQEDKQSLEIENKCSTLIQWKDWRNRYLPYSLSDCTGSVGTTWLISQGLLGTMWSNMRISEVLNSPKKGSDWTEVS